MSIALHIGALTLRAIVCAAIASPAIIWPAAAPAQPATSYYAGKQVKVIIGLGTGGGYDLWGRMVARHVGRHLPGNPNVIAQNMEGAGSFRAASYMANQARFAMA
jgi:tripartite-type tricarboxylate transporter receptor subunit TctC